MIDRPRLSPRYFVAVIAVLFLAAVALGWSIRALRVDANTAPTPATPTPAAPAAVPPR